MQVLHLRHIAYPSVPDGYEAEYRANSDEGQKPPKKMYECFSHCLFYKWMRQEHFAPATAVYLCKDNVCRSENKIFLSFLFIKLNTPLLVRLITYPKALSPFRCIKRICFLFYRNCMQISTRFKCIVTYRLNRSRQG